MSPSKSVISAEQAKLIGIRACSNDEDDVTELEVIDYRLEPYSNSKVGFLGSHQKLTMSIRRSSNNDTKSMNFFVKSIPRDSEAQTEFVKQRRVFDQEAEFFVKLMPRLLEVTSIADVEPWAPRCYLANENLIVMEDVRDRGFQMRDSKTLTHDELTSAVKSMARMHAASMLAERKLGKRLNELYPRACVEMLFHSQIREHGLPLIESLIVDVAKRHEDNRRMSEVKDLTNSIRRVFDFVNRDGEHRVICHGDCWPNNVMLDDTAKCLLVDYQMTRYASRMLDVAQLICLSTYREARDKDEKTLVRAYWQELCETLSKCEPSIERPTYDQLVDEYYEAKYAALFIAVMYLPTTLLGEDVFAEYKDDPAVLYRKFVFRRDNECVLELMDRDREYARRIGEVVVDFLECAEKIAADEKL